VQGVRGREHLSAPARQERVHGVRGPGPLPAAARGCASGAGARSSAAGASATTSAFGATAGSARGQASASTSAGGTAAPSAGAGACASTSARGASARRAARMRMSRCQMGWRSSGRAPWAVVMRPAREESQSSVAPHSREELRSRGRGEGRVANFKNRV